MFVCLQEYQIIHFVVTSFLRFPSVIHSFRFCILDTLMSLTAAHSKYLQAPEQILPHNWGFSFYQLAPSAIAKQVLCQNSRQDTTIAKWWLRHHGKMWPTPKTWRYGMAALLRSLTQDPGSCSLNTILSALWIPWGVTNSTVHGTWVTSLAVDRIWAT